MCRRRVEIVIKLLHVLAVVTLRPGQTEQSLFQNRIFAVPKRERETKPALPIGDAQQSIFTPAISAAARVIVWKIIPAISVGRIIFTDCRPLPLGEVRPPAFPVASARGVLSQTLFLHALTAQGFWIHALLVDLLRNSLRGQRWRKRKVAELEAAVLICHSHSTI